MKIDDLGEIKKICVVGLGNVGLPTALHIQSRGIDVFGIDINDKIVEIAKRAGIQALNAAELTKPYFSEVGFDAFVVCVGTGFENKSPDMKNIYKVASDIRAIENKPKIVSFESTMYPGTARFVANELLNDEVSHVFACPHRWWSENPEKYGVAIKRVVGTVKKNSVNAAYDFYTTVLGIPVKVVSTVETAELCKITENGRRYVDISYSEYIKMLCGEYDVDFNELRESVNTHFAHDMKEARDGIGGECLPLAVNYLNDMLESSMFWAVKLNDEQYQRFITEKE